MPAGGLSFSGFRLGLVQLVTRGEAISQRSGGGFDGMYGNILSQGGREMLLISKPKQPGTQEGLHFRRRCNLLNCLALIPAGGLGFLRLRRGISPDRCLTQGLVHALGLTQGLVHALGLATSVSNLSSRPLNCIFWAARSGIRELVISFGSFNNRKRNK